MNGACSEPTPCLSANDCPTDAPCTVGVNDELTDLFGECATYGALAPGSECNDLDDPAELPFAERCSALYCFGGMCTEVCQIDNNCPSGMSCEVLQLSNVDDTIMVCMADPGCGAPADCEEGESCWPALDGNQLRGWCTANGGIDPVGTNCDQYADTCEVFCLEPLCTEWCTFDEDCPDGMSCEIVYFCLVEPCSDPNNMAQASMCLQDPTGAR